MGPAEMSRACRCALTKFNNRTSSTSSLTFSIRTILLGLVFLICFVSCSDGTGYIEPRQTVPGLNPWDSTFWWIFYNITNTNNNSFNTNSTDNDTTMITTASKVTSSTALLLNTPPEAILINNNETDNGEAFSIRPTPSATPKKAFLDKHRPKLMRSECHVFEDYQLYDMLAEQGAYNQRFMANNAEEIAHRMLTDFNIDKDIENNETDTSNNNNHGLYKGSWSFSKRSSNELPCGWQCRKIKRILSKAIEEHIQLKKVNTMLTSNMIYNSPENAEEDDSNSSFPAALHVLEKSMHNLISDVSSDDSVALPTAPCNAEHFIPIGDCELRGTETVTGYGRLCTECRGVYRMPQGCFPQFLNAVRCNDTDISCIHDGWSNVAHGQCKAKSMSFTVMRNVGTHECQNWRFETVQIPIACECFLNKSSWLQA